MPKTKTKKKPIKSVKRKGSLKGAAKKLMPKKKKAVKKTRKARGLSPR